MKMRKYLKRDTIFPLPWVLIVFLLIFFVVQVQVSPFSPQHSSQSHPSSFSTLDATPFWICTCLLYTCSLITCVVTIQGQAGSWYSCRWINIHRAIGIVRHAFIHEGMNHACCKLCVYLHDSECHISGPLLSSVAPIMPPVPLCVSN